MKKILPTLVGLITAISSYAQAPTFQWAKQIGSTSYDSGNSVALDASGNVYTAGYFSAVADFDPGVGTTSLTATGLNNGFVTKLDASGNFIWAKNVAEGSDSYAQSVVFDGSGNIYVTGVFNGTTDFDPGVGTTTISTNGNDDIFLSKLDAAGNLLWVKTIGGANNDASNSVAVDASGNPYITGFFGAIVDFDPGAGVTSYTAATGVEDIFVLKLTAAGNLSWARQMASTAGTNIGYFVKIDASGNVYTTGFFENSVDFDPGVGTTTLTSFGDDDSFISKLDASGNFIWAKQIGSTGYDNSYAITFDATGNVYTTGYFANTVDLDPGVGTFTVSSMGNSDLYISKLDAAGNFIWGKTMGGTDYDISYCIAVDASGGVYTTGTFVGTVDFDPNAGTTNLIGTGAADAFVSKIDATGNFVWAVNMGGTSSSVNGYGILMNPAGDVYTTGSFDLMEDFDPSAAGTNTLSSNGYIDIFIHKLSQCITPLAPANTTATVNLTFCSGNTTTLTATGTGTISWYATATSTTVLGTGSSFTTPVLGAGTYTYYTGASTCTTSVTRTAVTLTVNTCTGIQQLKTAESLISLYPNPSNGLITVQLDFFTKELSIEVYNALGKLILKQKPEAELSTIDLSAEANGIYFVKLVDNTKVVAVEKIMKH